MGLHLGIGDRTKDNEKKLVTIVFMMIIDSNQRLKDPYNADFQVMSSFELPG